MKNKEEFEFEYDLNGHAFVQLNILLKTLGWTKWYKLFLSFNPPVKTPPQ